MEDGHAALSPLRFHYDSDDFTLPIRLGMASNAEGKQDPLIVKHHLHRRQALRGRELQERRDPDEGFDVRSDVRKRFGEFPTRRCSTRRSRRTRARSSPSTRGRRSRATALRPVPRRLDDHAERSGRGSARIWSAARSAAGTFVMTRLHARYSKGDMKDDLRFTGGVRDHRRPRGMEPLRRGSSTARCHRRRILLPSALRDSPSLVRADRVHSARAQHLGRPAERRGRLDDRREQARICAAR